ncbi:acyl-CoA thioesterase [Paenibacillus azoreducens]|uniref:Acyl-CoA thioesterase n=1 Tax=Paenibacillus azoreducens TaxID=116718 RepID=A0A920CSE6_9BACL|nr:thioesterase family protein [Paenibacillus azoreducens]GIO49210.1 hypothetical protein J34TS1_39750 [Paenibacillus azoreducens]
MSNETIKYNVSIAPRFEDMDAYGIIHHSRYLIYAEEAKLAFMKDPKFFATDVAAAYDKFLVTEVNIKYIRSVKYFANTLLDIELQFSIENEVKIRFDFAIYQNKSVACRGYSIHVVTDHDNRLRLELPVSLKNRYQELISQGERS